MKLLHIIASPRGTKSRTLQISQHFLQAFREKFTNASVEEIDLFKTDLPPILGSKVDAKYMILGQEELNSALIAAWERISAYAHKFLSFDVYLISAPMWNFSIPYQLKHYIDIIVQPGILFKITDAGPVGLALNKKMICITSRGSNYEVPFLQDCDFQENYLWAIFGLIGITDISFIKAQPMDWGPQLSEGSIKQARLEAKQLVMDMEPALME